MITRPRLVAAVEAAAAEAWPATFQEPGPDGWLLRATPGLDRGRSNHALPPCLPLAAEEVHRGLAAAGAFARRHGVRLGVQVSPLELQDELVRVIEGRGWESPVSVLVLAAAREEVLGARAGARLELETADRATPEWLSAWAACEGRDDVEAHAQTVFAELRGRARFARAGSRGGGDRRPVRFRVDRALLPGSRP